jgi:hypothetical protein
MSKASATESGKIKSNFKSSAIGADDSYEICISCKSQTDILRSTNIDHRYGYVVGLGQLCISCYKKNPF